MAATIIDVAKRCGYSKATVSRAYASPQVVKEHTREKIYAAAKELNYAPNAIARAMVRQRTENIAFIIHEKQYPAILNPFYSGILEAAIQEATKRGYSLFITPSQNMSLPSGEIFVKKQMDGAIFAGEADGRVIEYFMSQNIPVVLLNNYLKMKNLLCITVDHIHGAEAATEHLIRTGHKRIGLIAGRFSKQVSEARRQGFENKMNEHHLGIDESLIAEIDPIMEDAETVVMGMLKSKNRPTALFCTNDTIAVGAIKAIHRAGLRVKKDVAVVGFDDSSISRLIEPELTTVRIDAAHLGNLAATKLFELIDGKRVSKKQIEVPTKLIIRDSA